VNEDPHRGELDVSIAMSGGSRGALGTVGSSVLETSGRGLVNSASLGLLRICSFPEKKIKKMTSGRGDRRYGRCFIL